MMFPFRPENHWEAGFRAGFFIAAIFALAIYCGLVALGVVA